MFIIFDGMFWGVILDIGRIDLLLSDCVRGKKFKWGRRGLDLLFVIFLNCTLRVSFEDVGSGGYGGVTGVSGGFTSIILFLFIFL